MVFCLSLFLLIESNEKTLHEQYNVDNADYWSGSRNPLLTVFLSCTAAG